MSERITEDNNYRSNFVKATFNGNLPYDPNLVSFKTKSGKKVYLTYFEVLSDDYYNGYQTTSDMNCIAFGQHALDIARNFHAGDFVEANGTIDTYPTKRIQGKSLKYPVTITRFNIYKLDNLRKSSHNSKPSQNGQQKPKAKKPADKKRKKTTVGGSNQKLDISDDDLPF